MKKFILSGFLLLGFLVAPTLDADVISEFEPNPVGADPTDVSFELFGAANAAFDLWIVSIESDETSAKGLVDRAANVTGTYDSFGLAAVMIPDLENPSFTVILASDFTGTVGTTNIDSDGDGVADDLSAFAGIMDAIGIPDNVGDEAFLYGADVGGADFAYTGDEPRLTFRDGTSGAWYAINDPDGGLVFDINGVDISGTGTFDIDPLTATFGTVNPSFTVAVPEPASMALIGLGMLGLVVRRRR